MIFIYIIIYTVEIVYKLKKINKSWWLTVKCKKHLKKNIKQINVYKSFFMLINKKKQFQKKLST